MAGYQCALLLFCVVVGLCSAADPVCKNQINSCSCQTDQGLVDLSPLDSGDPNNAKFSLIPDGTSTGDKFSYNPCSPFTFEGSSCANVAACQTQLTETYSIGVQSSAVFETDPTDGLRIKYSAPDSSTGVIRQTYVTLKCDQSEGSVLTAIGENPPESSIYRLTLTSKYACPSGGGGGGGPVEFPCRFWLLLAASLCIILGLSCLGLVTYILCRKPSNVPSGGATMHSYYNESIDKKTNVGYKKV